MKTVHTITTRAARHQVVLPPVVTARHLATLLMLVLGSLSCGGDDSTPGGEAGGGAGGQELCPVPNRLLEDGSCLAPGVQDNGCPAGELGLEDGSCQPAGVPPELCADGFEPLDQGCEPILPADPCPPGLMAVPGDTVCREVAPCGTGRWGDIPIDGSTEHVDGAYAGGNNDGTADRPWTTIGEAIDAAAPGALVAIATGSYAEDIDIAGKPVTLWGVCPAEVEVVGSTAAGAAVIIRTAADGTQVRSLAIRGDTAGLAVSSSQNVALDRLWVHDNASVGIVAQETLGPTAFTLSGALLEQNHEIGVFVGGSDATIESTVVRNTLPRASDQAYGIGIGIQPDPSTGKRASATLRASLLEQNRDLGVLVGGSDAIIEGTVIRTTMPQASDQTSGRGISIDQILDMTGRANVTLRASLVEQNHDIGVFVQGSDAIIEGTIVRTTMPQASDLADGRGINIQHNPDTAVRANVTLRASLVEQNHLVGVVVLASDSTIEGTIVRDTLPQASNEARGVGISAQPNQDTAERASMTLHASLVEQNHQVGVIVFGSDVTIKGTVVRTTLPQTSDGLFGDGIVIAAYSSPASALISSCLAEANARVGVAVFGAHTSLAATALECNLIDLNQESFVGFAGTFDDQGDNRCGCGTEPTVCKAVSEGLEPPAPVGPSD
ncbi:MAG: hypothetical protein DRI90_25660 [Deltaproteobacteria bacterium]|nr:MAG: hypothetical protein DRI90_25660 [Deltaproteobacteria bacterium]